LHEAFKRGGRVADNAGSSGELPAYPCWTPRCFGSTPRTWRCVVVAIGFRWNKEDDHGAGHAIE
jgi:hypothetical protein